MIQNRIGPVSAYVIVLIEPEEALTRRSSSHLINNTGWLSILLSLAPADRYHNVCVDLK